MFVRPQRGAQPGSPDWPSITRQDRGALTPRLSRPAACASTARGPTNCSKRRRAGLAARHRTPQRQAQYLAAAYQMEEQVKTYLEASKLARRTAACFSDKHRTRIRLAIIVQKLVE